MPDPALSNAAASGHAPATLSLFQSSRLSHQPACLGMYLLVAGREAFGRPVWKHEREDRWIAKIKSGRWSVQQEADVGVTSQCYLILRDEVVLWPNQSGVKWQEWTGNGVWNELHGLLCVATSRGAQQPAPQNIQAPAKPAAPDLRCPVNGCGKIFNIFNEQGLMQHLAHKQDSKHQNYRLEASLAREMEREARKSEKGRARCSTA